MFSNGKQQNKETGKRKVEERKLRTGIKANEKGWDK